MSVLNCLADLVTKKQISQETAETIRKSYNENPGNIGDMIQKNKKTTQETYTNHKIDIKKRMDIENSLKENPGNTWDILTNLVARAKGDPSKSMNIEYKIKQVQGNLLAPLSKHFDALRSKVGGLKINKKLLDDVSMTIFHGSKNATNTETNAIVKAMQDTLDTSNTLAKRYGLDTIDNLSQLAPLSNKIQGMTAEEFYTFVKPLVTDTDKHIKDMYEIALQGEEIGKFTFKSGKASSSYQMKVGGDAFGSLINYTDRLTANIASADVLGKNGLKTLTNMAKKYGLSSNEIHQLTNMYENATGTIKVKVPKNIYEKAAANVLSSLRALGTAVMMGSSPITALLDIATMGLTAKYNGLPLMKMYGQMLKNLASKESRMEMSQLGFQLESVLSALSNTSRFNPHSSTNDTLNKVATGVLRVSGLLAMSDAMKLAVKNTFLVTFKDLSSTTFEGLSKKNPKFLKQLKAYGINKDDWNKIRKNIGDDIVLNPMNLESSQRSKVFRMINEEADYAVVTPGSRSAYWTSLGQDKGTLMGEAVKSVTQFKSTIVEQVTTHLYRAAKQQGVNNKLAYAAQYFAATTILGGMVHSLKEIAKGNTPPDPMEDPLAFLSDSMRQGGAVPILTDNLIPHQMDPKYGGGQIEDILGMASLSTPMRLISNGVKAATSGDKATTDKAQSALTKDLMRMIPGQNIWYVKAFNEYAKSYMGYMIDPAGERKRQRRIDKELKKSGQKQMLHI